MGVMMKQEVMDWSKFTAEEWLKQYGAYIAQSQMKGGHEPDHLETNQIYWLVRSANKNESSRGKFVFLQINEFEYQQIDKLTRDILNSKALCKSARVCVSLYFHKMINGYTEKQLAEKFIFSESKLREMAYCGKFYIAGHDKRLLLDAQVRNG